MMEMGSTRTRCVLPTALKGRCLPVATSRASTIEESASDGGGLSTGDVQSVEAVVPSEDAPVAVVAGEVAISKSNEDVASSSAEK